MNDKNRLALIVGGFSILHQNCLTYGKMVSGGKAMLKKITFILSLFMALGFGQPAGAVALIEHEVIKTDTVDVLIPFIKNEQKSAVIDEINAILQDNATKNLDEFKDLLAKESDEYGIDSTMPRYDFHSRYSVKLNTIGDAGGGIISIITYGYIYTGGMHGYSFKRAVTANTETGQIYKLPDLFAKGVNYKKILDDIIKKQIDSRGEWKGYLEFKGVDENTKFCVASGILTIFYEEYEIGSYSMGAPEFYIPVMDLRQSLKEEIYFKFCSW